MSPGRDDGSARDWPSAVAFDLAHVWHPFAQM